MSKRIIQPSGLLVLLLLALALTFSHRHPLRHPEAVTTAGIATAADNLSTFSSFSSSSTSRDFEGQGLFMASSNWPLSALPSGLVTIGHLPLIDCEHCGRKVICLKSRADEVFYKCPNNYQANTEI